MIVTIKFSTGKVIELTEEELKELYGQCKTYTFQPPIFMPANPFVYPYTTPASPWCDKYPVVTCQSHGKNTDDH
jgi:hypothetical protein